MKRCSNPHCRSSFLYGDSKTHCPFCHAPLVSNESGVQARPLITPVNAAFEDFERTPAAPQFIMRRGRSMQCTGRVVEIEHQALFYGKAHKLFNTVVRGEPFQFSHQNIEYTIRVEPIADEIPDEVTDFCLYGNYLGRIQVGDEVRIRAKDCRHRRVVKSIVNLTTGSAVKPGLQIQASFIRGVLLIALLMFIALAWEVVHFVSSGAAAALAASILAACMPILIAVFGLWFLFRSMFPEQRERRRR